MNICRSPAMEQQLQAQTSEWENLGAGPVHIVSAGTEAITGAPNCDITLEHLGVSSWSSESDRLTPDQLSEADLVLTAAASHISTILALEPGAHSRTFTLRQAAQAAHWIAEGPVLATAVAKAAGGSITPNYEEPTTLTTALPAQADQRLRWLVSELAAVRGTFPTVGSDPDIPDPHLLGFELHQSAAELIGSAVQEFSQSVQRILAAEIGGASCHG